MAPTAFPLRLLPVIGSFEAARYAGTSIEIMDRHYGQLVLGAEDSLDQKMSESTSPTAPTTMRMTPTVLRLTPEAVAVTAHFRMAPTAMKMRLTLMPMS